MSTVLRVLTDAEIARIHEESLAALARTGMRIDSAKARRILGEAGARVRRGGAPGPVPARAGGGGAGRCARGSSRSAAGGPGFPFALNAGECTLMPDGEATTFYDPVEGVRRAPTWDDWVNATKLVDTMDEVGAYWRMVTSGLESEGGPGPAVAHWRNTFGLFSKHVQDEIATEADAAWLLELLATIFGSKEAVRRDHPYSVLFCPVVAAGDGGRAHRRLAGDRGLGHPDRDHADADDGHVGARRACAPRSCPATRRCWGRSCLAQAASQGTPVIYAPALAAMEPRTGRWGGGGPEHSLLGAATTEMARFYGLPVIASNGGTDHFVTGRPGRLRADAQLDAAGAVLAGHHDRPGVPGRRLHAVPGADGHRRRGLPDVPPAPRGDRRRDRARRTCSRRWRRWGRWATSSPARRPATRCAAASGSCPGSDPTPPSTAGRRPAGPDVVGQAREAAMAAIAGHQPLPFPDEVAAALERLEQAARSGAPAPATGVRHDAVRGGIPERGRAGARARGRRCGSSRRSGSGSTATSPCRSSRRRARRWRGPAEGAS